MIVLFVALVIGMVEMVMMMIETFLIMLMVLAQIIGWIVRTLADE